VLDAQSPLPVVLVVDDELGVRELLRHVLPRAGFKVVDAWSAERATEILASGEVSLAICDHHLPGKDGLWLGTHIQELFPGVATLFMSGDANALHAARPLRFSGYVAKPFDPKGMVQAIQHALARHANREQG